MCSVVGFRCTLASVPPPGPAVPRRVVEIDWNSWVPTERATLVFVRRAGEILLIRKKRGLGAGKINGPGGRMEPGESSLECALREAKEELGITPLDAVRLGELSFQFLDGFGLFGHVFVAFGHQGEPFETDEAVPLWTPIEAIPYEQMWADDVLWFPHLLAGRRFRGRFIFDGDSMLDQDVEAWDAP